MADGKVFPARQIGGPRLTSRWASRGDYLKARAEAEAKAERDKLERNHRRLQKLNAALVREGRNPGYICPPSCPICHPPEKPKVTKSGKAEVERTKDLRGTTKRADFLRGKRGRCRTCGKKIRGVPNWFLRYYCDEHRPASSRNRS